MARIIQDDIGQFLEVMTQEYLIDQALGAVNNDVDKREGSIIYDAVAAACDVLADFVIELRQAYQQTYAGTATGAALVMRTSEMGVYPDEATHAKVVAEFTDVNGNPYTFISMGDEFSTIATEESDTLIYEVVDFYKVEGEPIAGMYLMSCKELGTRGNEYTGQILPLSNYMNLQTARVTEVVIPAKDAESDESLRQKYFDSLDNKSFGGNVTQYREQVMKLDGVGAVQVYPTWDGGGTTRISILNNSFMPASTLLLETIKDIMDPLPSEGKGLGLAPVGHTVSVVTAETVEINVSANITVTSGIPMPTIQTQVEQAIDTVLSDLRSKQWGVPDELNNHVCEVYIARITASLLLVSGISNVTGVLLNGVAQDITLTQTAVLQQIPILGEVTLTNV